MFRRVCAKRQGNVRGYVPSRMVRSSGGGAKALPSNTTSNVKRVGGALCPLRYKNVSPPTPTRVSFITLCHICLRMTPLRSCGFGIFG